MVGISIGLLTVLVGSLGQQSIMPTCVVEPGRRAERIAGTVKHRERFDYTTPFGWIVRLAPGDQGWFLTVAMKDRESEDLARLTPPFHFGNPRQIEGWHLRNAENTGPNDGSVNAPAELREFIFSPSVGRGIEYNGNATTADEVEKVRSFGRGWLYISSYQLTPPKRGERAAFESLTFSACLTWPAS